MRPSANSDPRVVVGRVGKPHGIRGDVTVELRTDEPQRRFAPGSVLSVAGTETSLTVEAMRLSGRGLVVHFAGCDGRDSAESLRDTLLEVTRAPGEMPAEDDEYYDSDLVGLRAQDDQGHIVGVINDVVHLPGQDLLSIVASTADGGTGFLLPFVEQFVPDVNLAEGVVLIRPPEGLTEDEGTDAS
ncbi:MAG: ribosome maturation factor RimM [Actinomycetes bacterium]